MKKRYYYHATSMKNIGSIAEHGLRPSSDGMVYLAPTELDSLKFMAFRLDIEQVAILRVDTEKVKLVETFDHSEEFFKCKAYGYAGTIDPDRIEICEMYIRR